MTDVVTVLKNLILSFCKDASKAEEINNSNDYKRVKSWVKRTYSLYRIFTIISILLTPIVYALISAVSLEMGGFPFIIYLLIPFYCVLVGFGFATIIIYFKKISKTVVNAGKLGFNTGEKFETTHVNVTHEYGNTYSVSSYTENKGCLFAFIFAFAAYMIWGAFCLYVGPFLTFKKLRESKRKLAAYSEKTYTQ